MGVFLGVYGWAASNTSDVTSHENIYIYTYIFYEKPKKKREYALKHILCNVRPCVCMHVAVAAVVVASMHETQTSHLSFSLECGA